jgi:hypothetical protein
MTNNQETCATCANFMPDPKRPPYGTCSALRIDLDSIMYPEVSISIQACSWGKYEPKEEQANDIN